LCGNQLLGIFCLIAAPMPFFPKRVVSFCLCVLIIERGGSVNEKKRKEKNGWLYGWMMKWSRVRVMLEEREMLA
jgi:hypothetical protein